MTDNEIIQQYKKYEPIFGSWYIKRFVGEGGFAKVFEIVRNDFGREYVSALKIITVSKTKSEINTLKSEGMTDDDIKRYMYNVVEDTVSEIKLMYKLRGKGNIVSYEDHAVVEHEDGMGWDILIKMEYLTSLSTYIRQQNGRLAKRDIIKLGVDICKSLEYCQRYNIIHRDIKADNIFISDDGEFKLGDFGIARVIERKDQTLSKKGTSAYMAPEVYKGQTYTSAVDIYSLGMVMYRLMNNNRGPFLPPYPQPMSLDDRDRAMMLRMSGEKFPKPGQVTRGRLVEIVLKACAYRPEERYSSPLFMRQELESIYLDQDEMTTEEWVTIYDDQAKSTTLSSMASFGQSGVGQSGISEPKSAEPAGRTEALREEGTTEVLREEGVTEVLRGDATEVLREEGATEVLRGESPAKAGMQAQPAGSSDAADPSSREKPVDKRTSLWKTGKPLVIGGICAAVLVLGVIIGVAVTHSGSSEQYVVQETAEPTQKPQETPEPTQEPISWTENILMSDMPDYNSGDMNRVLGSKLERRNIYSITFLDSLDTMGDDAWDVSEDQSGKVMAWAVPCDVEGKYDLYIGAEGGVAAHKNCYGLFEFYTNVQSVQINGNFHTEKAEVMYAMFAMCEKLATLDVSGFDTLNVTIMENMFLSCKNMTDLDVSSFDTSNVTDMSYMFQECNKLESLDLSGFDTSKVTNMCSMFQGCNKLESLDISGFNTSNVTDMKSMFQACNNLKNVDLSSFDTSNVTDMSYMFRSCNIESLDVSSFDTSKVTNMACMFNGCTKLQNLDVSGFDTSNVTNMSFMFLECSSLTNLDLSSFDTANVTDMSYMFGGCCWTDLDLSSFDTSNVTNMGSMFADCTNLENLDLSGFNTSKVTDMNWMFGGCTNLQNLDVSSFDASAVRDAKWMFVDCNNLSGLDLSGFSSNLIAVMDIPAGVSVKR